MDTVTVNAEALRRLLVALSGPPHYIRELQVTRDPPFGKDNPINILGQNYVDALKAHTAATNKQAPA